jgi:sugar/nucleoside kinase (ribokinase family)
MTTEISNTIETAVKRAETLGTKHGRNAAEWAAQDAFGGRHTGDSEAAAREFLRMAEDGDPVLFDRYQAPNLSGEWADNMTIGRLMDHCFATEDDLAECADSEDEICLAYEDAASNGFWGRLEECAALVLDN